MPTTAPVQNFKLLPTGEVLLQICRTLVGRDGQYARANVVFLIAANYWSPQIFVADGKGGWKDPLTHEASDEGRLADKIRDVIDLQITQDPNFKAAFNAAIKAIVDTPQGQTVPPVSVWPSHEIQIINDVDLEGFLSELRTQTAMAEDSVENSDKSSISMGTADSFSGLMSQHPSSTSTYAAFSLSSG